MAQARDIGIDVKPPTAACTDTQCPFHGTLPVRGQTIDGQIISSKMERSVVVQREYLRYIAKYERFEKRTSKYTAHLPPCLPAQVGDLVTIMECRPLSKTKNFVVIEARRGALRITGMDYTVEGEAETAAAKPAKVEAAPPTTAKPKKAAKKEA